MFHTNSINHNYNTRNKNQLCTTKNRLVKQNIASDFWDSKSGMLSQTIPNNLTLFQYLKLN